MSSFHRRTGYGVSLGGATILGALAATPAVTAAAADQATTSNSPAGQTLEEIVVSARKRSERLLDVPVAASVLSSEQISERGIAGLEQLQNLEPELQFTTVNGGTGGLMALRGISSNPVESGVENKVSLNIDGVPTSRGRLAGLGLFDLSGVEVLKGPQALYFGKNSTTGVVALTSADPGDKLEGYTTTGIEPYALQYYGEGALTVPLAEGFSARIAARGSYMDKGYVENVAGPITDPAQLPTGLALGLYGPGVTLPGRASNWSPQTRDAAARLTLKYDRGGPFNANFKFLYAHQQDNGPVGNSITLGCGTDPVTGQPLSAQTRYGDFGHPAGLIDPYGSCAIGRQTSEGALPAAVAAGMPGSNGGKPFSDLDAFVSSLTLNYDIVPEVSLTSVTGYQNTDFHSFVSGVDVADFSAYAYASGESFDSVSQEFRLHTDFAVPVNFSGGAYYESTGRSEYAGSFSGYFGPDPVTGRTDTLASNFYQTGKTYSAYGELTWKIVPTVELAGGARYSHEKKTTDNTVDYVHALFAARSLPAGSVVAGQLTSNNVSPQVSLSWHPTNNVMLYGAYKTGYLSGGFSAPPLMASSTPAQFNPEKVKGFEFGTKFSGIFDAPLSGDLTYFDYKYQSLQITEFDPVTTLFFISNAGSATTRGVEAKLNFAVTPRLQLTASGAYIESRYDSFPNAACYTGQVEGCVYPPGSFTGETDLSGAPLPRAPKWVASLGASYEQPVSAAWTVGFTSNLRYSSWYFASGNNSPFNREGGYTILDASVRLVDDKGWEFSVIGKNLANKLYYVYGGDLLGAPPGETWVYPNLPRQVLIQATKRF